MLVQILTHPEDGFAACLPGEEVADFLEHVKSIVLATDMAAHKSLMADFSGWVDNDILASARRNSDNGGGGGGGGGEVGEGFNHEGPRLLRLLRGGTSATSASGGLHAGCTRGKQSEAASTSGTSRASAAASAGSSSVVPPQKLSAAQRTSLLLMTMKCADLSGLVVDLPRANFWGYRIMEENLRWGPGARILYVDPRLDSTRLERESRVVKAPGCRPALPTPQPLKLQCSADVWYQFLFVFSFSKMSMHRRVRIAPTARQGMREQREGLKQTTPASREIAEANYFNRQAGFLQHVVQPMFETYTVGLCTS
jgi:hypothetical protein